MAMNHWKLALTAMMALLTVAAATTGAPAQSATGGRLRLELFVDDTAKSVAFYKDVLGFETVREEKGYTAMRLGSVEFGINGVNSLSRQHYFQPDIAKQRKGLGAEIVIEVDDVQAAFDRVKQNGHKIESPLIKRPWGLTDFRIADPDGYYLRISSMSL
jgi:catechol 2,3-dioxygenase-like lactoylglutathione lyase family enzyme